jgi:hypothetical protein
MRGKAILAFGAAAVALAAAGVVATATSGITRAETLRLVSHTTESKFLLIGHTGAPQQGDEFIIHERLTDLQGNPMGEDGIVCTETSTVGHGQLQCLASFSLPKGELTAQLLLGGNAGSFDAAVNGGTGAYSNARGFAHIVSRSATVSDETFYLIP